ncbi:MAG TPA: DegT/DnrJ/EryC1/StrS family aminotransferase [Candidatus Sumerlaeota bacterium]|nr:MAG: UDP-4-amino-4-deoxy-L-arabinose--oxoglutarate aminotransferase [candidate division BRC1 bacterium ADurb.BinA292]HOR28863.1 DegT/DnrJ/EryC1/StrS family aminotransferase [Candidatus Sumerlaeota bacterium]HPK03470.1 DegT/DnrJ/EryC1/StrS family aminotransferase [Candidatus Sumerlaeota bacterium]
MGSLAWRFDQRERIYINEVLDSGFASSTTGTMNQRLEAAFAARFGRKYAVTCNSGTTTLHAALVAIGVGFGDEVITTPLTVISCMNAIVYCNAIPVFADVDPNTFLLDPDDVERKITPRTRAIMPVHLYGQVCDMTRIMEIAQRHDLAVLEDCAQCYLGTHRGRIGGTFGNAGSWSFENSKHLTTGDGGILACDSEELGTRLRKLCCQGFRTCTAVSGQVRLSKDDFQNPNYKRHDSFGFMYRLPEVAAAMGLAQLEKIDWFVAKREQMARLYAEAIQGVDWLVPQQTPAGDRNSYYTFALRFLKKDVSWEAFRKKHIEYGGDGAYAAWTLCYLEDSVPEILALFRRMGLDRRMATDRGICPHAEMIQRELMQFTTNQKDEDEMKVQAEALYRTVRYFS